MGTEYDAMRSLEARVSRQEQRITDMGGDVITLKESMDKNTEALSAYIELSKNLKVGLKLLGYLESFAVWVTKVAGAVVIMWGVWKFVVKQAIEK